MQALLRALSILQHFKLILTAKADSTSLVVFRKFKRLISLLSAYRMVNNQIMYRRLLVQALLRALSILQHFKLILTAKADSTSLVVFRKFKRLISLVSAYRMVNNQIMYRRLLVQALLRALSILQHFKLILTAKADSTSLVVFRKFKRLISLVSAYRMVNNQIMYRRTGKRFAR